MLLSTSHFSSYFFLFSPRLLSSTYHLSHIHFAFNIELTHLFYLFLWSFDEPVNYKLILTLPGTKKISLQVDPSPFRYQKVSLHVNSSTFRYQKVSLKVNPSTWRYQKSYYKSTFCPFRYQKSILQTSREETVVRKPWMESHFRSWASVLSHGRCFSQLEHCACTRSTSL